MTWRRPPNAGPAACSEVPQCARFNNVLERRPRHKSKARSTKRFENLHEKTLGPVRPSVVAFIET